MPCGAEGAAPQTAGGIDFFALIGNDLHRYMDKMIVPVTYQHRRLAGHAGMDAVATQKIAEDPVVGIGRKTPDHIAGIDIFN